MKKEEGKVVCVTSTSGFIASRLVKDLLLNGYTIKATVRNLTDPTKVDHLKALQGAAQRLRLFEADLQEEGSFDAAIHSCDGVFHTACPIIFQDIKDPQKELIQPAVNRCLNVLRSCLKALSIKRVVLTSSMTTIVASKSAIMCDVALDETWYSDPKVCRQNKVVVAWYYLAKTLAEEAAGKFAKEHGIDLVVINPGFVLGCSLQSNVNNAFEEFLMLIREGKCAAFAFGVYPSVDVKDVVCAHV